jgi:hypothetical protein
MANQQSTAAPVEYAELLGNGALLEASRLLLTLSTWKAKPHLLRGGHISYAARTARAVLVIFARLEGLPERRKWELYDQLQRELCPQLDLEAGNHG